MKGRNFWISGVLLFLFVIALLYLLKKDSKSENIVPKEDTFVADSHTIEGDLSTITSNKENPVDGDRVEIEEKSDMGNYKIQITQTIEETVNNIKEMKAGTLVDTTNLSEDALRSLFYLTEITPDIEERIRGKSYPADAKISLDELSYIRVLHKGFDEETYIGELIMNKAVAEDIVEIFWELYQLNYPIEKVLLVDEFDADDETSMEANNTSAFNYRVIAGTNRLSLHGQGLAIDINPLYNPYITTIEGKKMILPENGAVYEDRNLEIPYYIRKDDELYNTFIKRGFTWGGEWINSKDYQHFQKEINPS